MATITFAEARARARRTTSGQAGYKSASAVLAENAAAQNVAAQEDGATFDAFLSHAVLDADIILGLKGILEDHGNSVYVDWINDPHLDRTQLSPATAAVLRERMDQCKCLLYATTENSTNSKWMPWECGYFDGKVGKVAILPVTSDGSDNYKGREYLGLYPYVSENRSHRDENVYLWVHRDTKTYVLFHGWLHLGLDPQRRS